MANPKKIARRVDENDIDEDAYPSEMNIFAALIQHNGAALSYCGDLTDEHFSSPYISSAFRCASAMRLKSEAIDAQTLLFAVAKDLEVSEQSVRLSLQSAVVSLKNGADLKSVEGWAKIVKSRFIDRMIEETGRAMLDLKQNTVLSTEAKLAETKRLYDAAVLAAAPPSALMSATEMMRQTIEASMETQATGEVPGLSTGIKKLDEILGGLKSSELIVVAGRPAMGKTAFSLGSLVHAAAIDQGKAVLFVSLEMGTAQLGPRWLSRLTSISAKKIVEGRCTEEELRRMRLAMSDTAGAQLQIDETPVMTLAQIENRARQMHADTPGGLSLLVIDYLQLIKDSGRQGANKTERIGEISCGLKQLARELKIPVVALSQLNRKLEERQDKRPMMSDLRDSGAIEQDADVILFLYRDSVYSKNSPDADRAEIIVGKNRGGSNETVFAKFSGVETRFSDYAESRSSSAIDFNSTRRAHHA